MMKNYECKFDRQRRRPHLVKSPVQLPCQEIACWLCVVESRDYFCNLTCPACGHVHRVGDEILFKNSLFLERNLRLSFKEIGRQLNAKLHKTIFDFKDYVKYRKMAIENTFEFIDQSILVRVESIHAELENARDRFHAAIDGIGADLTDELTFIREKRVYLNTLKYQKPRPKMNYLLKELRKVTNNLRKSGSTVENLSQQLATFKASTKPLSRDKSMWIGSLRCALKPLVVSDAVDSRVRFVHLFGYTTNLTSLCALDDESVLVLDNYLNSVSLFDRYFNLIKTVCLNDLANVRRAHLAFNSNLYGIAASSRYVYINDMDRNQIVVVERSLDAIKSIFSPLSVKSIFELDVQQDELFVLDNRNREVVRFDATGGLIENIKLEATNLDKYAQNENFSKIADSERFASISNSFVVSTRHGLIACFRPFLGEINIHKMDGSVCHVIENIFQGSISICFAANALLAYSGTEGSVMFFECGKDESFKEPPERFGLVAKLVKPKLVCHQHYNFISCHKKIVFFDNRVFVLFSAENNIGLIEC